jgi:hypothetical protein
MNKAELLDRLQEQYQHWEAFLNQVDSMHMEQPGVNGDWSMKDMVAHLTGWNRWLVTRLTAAQRGEQEPLPPWPVHLQDENDINAWIYQANRQRPPNEILDEMRQVHQQLLATIEGMPDDVRIEHIEPAYYLVWVGNERFEAGEFFDHFHDDHEPDVRRWMKREGI